MFKGDWRIILTAFCGLATLTSAYGYYQVEEATRAEYAQNNYQPARDASFPKRRVVGEPKAQAYQPYCQQPENIGDADLCAQWGAVKAVDESNRLVRVGILVTFLLGALGIIATGIGAILVYRSLRQSEEALAHQRDVSERQLRPYMASEAFDPVYIEKHLINKQTGAVVGHRIGAVAFAHFWKNCGQTPAFNAWSAARHDLVESDFKGPMPIFTADNDGNEAFSIGPQMTTMAKTLLIPWEEITDVSLRKKRLILSYILKYRLGKNMPVEEEFVRVEVICTSDPALYRDKRGADMPSAMFEWKHLPDVEEA